MLFTSVNILSTNNTPKINLMDNNIYIYIYYLS